MNMKSGKTSESFWAVLEMLKAGRETCLRSLTAVFNDFLCEVSYYRNGVKFVSTKFYREKRFPQSEFVLGNNIVRACFRLYKTF